MPLILSNDAEAPGLRRKWINEYNHVVPDDVAAEFFGRAKFARLVTDNVRALAAFQSDLNEIRETVSYAIMVHNERSNPVEGARLTLLGLYVENLRRWRCVATRAQRQWRFAGEHGSGTKRPYFELPKDGWQERNNIERALNELESCTDRLPAGWGGGPFGQEEVEVVFDEGGVRMEEGGADDARGAGEAAPGLVDYSESEDESEDDSESEDDFVLTVNGQPAGIRMSNVFPGGEAEEESDTAESEEDAESSESESDGDSLASLPSLTDSDDSVESAEDEWETANRETTSEFINGTFIP